MTVRLTGVGKRYGRGGPWVLREVELALEPGEIVRIEGANGSGKSTLLKLLGGLERPSAGTLAAPARRAYVPERFPPALPFDARDYLRQHGRLRGLSTAEALRRADHWLERFGITSYATTPVGRLSKGTCQKVAVAQALLAEAELLLLDEAWTGLDRAARTELDLAVAERAAAGGLVVHVDHDPTRLAGLLTAVRTVEGGTLHTAHLPAPDPDGPRTTLVLSAPTLPPWLPPHTRHPDGTAEFDVPTAQSDTVLRRLLAATPPVHIHAVRPGPAGLRGSGAPGARGTAVPRGG
ncbi:ATP-binding cassette domain-containing protein [Kitasatospora sp. NPDC088391]|uniref:ABC transporter ATP-binding protein n=1 Tax=Kitasatospora sp. NPDC088391 TaxID=3364074 RepID=UPI00381FC20A